MRISDQLLKEIYDAIFPVFFVMNQSVFRDWMTHKKTIFNDLDLILRKENITQYFDYAKWKEESTEERLAHLRLILEQHEDLLAFLRPTRNRTDIRLVYEKWTQYPVNYSRYYPSHIEAVLGNFYQLKPLLLGADLRLFGSWLKSQRLSKQTFVNAFLKQFYPFFGGKEKFKCYAKEIWSKDLPGSKRKYLPIRFMLERDDDFLQFLSENQSALKSINMAWRLYLESIKKTEKASEEKIDHLLILFSDTCSSVELSSHRNGFHSTAAKRITDSWSNPSACLTVPAVGW